MKVPEHFRVKKGTFATSEKDGNQGVFIIPPNRIKGTRSLQVIASDGMGWDHVSVALDRYRQDKTPTWAEMCLVKDLFFDEGETTVQFHPKSSEYVNFHPTVLHIWKKQGQEHELPPSIMVGPK